MTTNPLANNHKAFDQEWTPKMVANRFNVLTGRWPTHIIYPPKRNITDEERDAIQWWNIEILHDKHALRYCYAGPVREE